MTEYDRNRDDAFRPGSQQKRTSRRRIGKLPGRAVQSRLSAGVREEQDDNAAADSADFFQYAAANSLDRLSDRLHGSEEKASSAHQRQKKAIKKQYAVKRYRKAAGVSANAASQAAQKTERTVRRTARRRKGTVLFLLAGLALLMMLNTVSSCTVLFQGVGATLAGSTYPGTDEAMLGAEEAYTEKEEQLRRQLEHYVPEGSYDELAIRQDEIRHDPYALISLLTAYHQGAWTLEEVQPTLRMLFDRQYILTESVETETRYRTETRVGYRMVYDPVTGQSHRERYEYEVQIPYSYKICTVCLENFNLSHLPIYVMGERQLSMYAMYMSTLGNRPDLFPQSGYPYASVYQEPLRYEVPEALLADERFARMLKEAEKYLGYPYIWGGYCPATSFDCSGFISWVINHSGWNYGRLGVDGLLAQCRPVSASGGRPGDLVFFQGTLDEPGATHVGLYVGNGMMIHCGSPISYADLNTPYWQSHFYGFGRLP